MSSRTGTAAPPPASIATGRPVPDFTLPASSAQPWRLKDARGSKLVLYFYPRDNTSGCTLEAGQFAALAARYHSAGAQIVGISRDSVASHAKFRAKLALPFELLSDQDESVCRSFGVLREKSLYGHRHIGIERSTFLIDARGVLRQQWRGVKVPGHAEQVLAAAEHL